jgi:hypothetical protein
VTGRRRAILQMTGATAVAVLLVFVIDRLTNSIDIARFSWDFRYYIDMARRGLEPPLASPFAYRYLTPLLVRGISLGLAIPVEAGFGLVTRVAAVTQLVGVFLLAKWYSKSTRGAWMAMFATAFSLYHVKFLLFDSFRPDHLAYPLILLQVYFALTGRFWPLWTTTLIGCQIREFNAIPLVASVAAGLWDARRSGNAASRATVSWQAVTAALGLAVAFVVPRLLIPISEDYQFVSLTRDGLLRAILAPFILARDANYIYAVLAYALPVLMLATPRQSLAALDKGSRSDRIFFIAYGLLVLAFSFLGGTDFYRFSTYLLPLMALVIAEESDRRAPAQLMVMLGAVFVFNRIWLPFPDTDLDRYLDFYGGSGTHFTVASVLRLVELASLLAVGLLLNHSRRRGGAATPPLMR